MKSQLIAILSFTGLLVGSMMAAEAATEMPMVCESSVLDAPMSAVWQALRAERTSDPAHRHVISRSGNDCIITERFEHLPIVGCATCTYKEIESEDTLQYQMLSSDKLKAFEGVWLLTPQNGGMQTLLKLSSRIDSGINAPFSKKITHDVTSRSIHQRLAEIKSIAERKQTALIAE